MLSLGQIFLSWVFKSCVLGLRRSLASGMLSAQSATSDDSAADLAKKLSSPIAALISVPFQNNFLFGGGPGDGFSEVTNIQPVIPFSLNQDWNLISRTILPVWKQALINANLK